MWNNVRYVWTLPTTTRFSRTPIWLLGACYHAPYASRLSPLDNQEEWDHFRAFLMDFTSRTWLTYRKEFPSLEQSDVTSDAGWGCMLRTGQMVLAEALVRHFLGREWRTQTATSDEFSTYRRLLRWFADVPSDDSPFGVHSLVNLSVKKGRRVGQWFGPAQISYLIRSVEGILKVELQ
jgi:cysteine protease ATG4